MKKGIILAVIILALLLSGCTRKVEQTPEGVETQTQEQEESVEYTSYMSGSYRNEYVEISFDKDSFILLEETSEDASDYFLSLIPAQGDPNSFPRIDIFAMDVSAMTEESVAKMGEDAAREDFGDFCEYLLMTYYPSILAEDGSELIPKAEVTRTGTEFEVKSEKKYGAAEFLVAENEYFSTPEMYAKVELVGGASAGMVKIMLYPELMPEAEKEQMQEQMEDIRFVA